MNKKLHSFLLLSEKIPFFAPQFKKNVFNSHNHVKDLSDYRKAYDGG